MGRKTGTSLQDLGTQNPSCTSKAVEGSDGNGSPERHLGRKRHGSSLETGQGLRLWVMPPRNTLAKDGDRHTSVFSFMASPSVCPLNIQWPPSLCQTQGQALRYNGGGSRTDYSPMGRVPFLCQDPPHYKHEEQNGQRTDLLFILPPGRE